MLMSRSINTKVPTLPSLLQPKVVDARPQLEQRQLRHKAVFDRGARKLSKLNASDVIRMRHNDVWQPAIVKRGDVHPRSYIVERDGNEYRRNRRQVLKTSKDRPLRATYDDDTDTFHVQPVDVEPDEVPPVPIAPRADVQRTPPRTTASGRTVTRPAKYEDYVCE